MSVATFSFDELTRLWGVLAEDVDEEETEEIGRALFYLGAANRAAFMATYQEDVEALDTSANVWKPTDGATVPGWAGSATEWVKNLLYNTVTNGGVDFAPEAQAKVVMDAAERIDARPVEPVVTADPDPVSAKIAAAASDRAETIKMIREALKERSGKTWSVTGGRGTGWGWIRIMSPPKRRVGHKPNPVYEALSFEEQRRADFAGDVSRSLDDTETEHRYYMSEADRAELAELLGQDRPVHCQGESIPSSTDYYRHYIERALGLPTTGNPQPYWD